jgi:hypothetical protein
VSERQNHLCSLALRYYLRYDVGRPRTLSCLMNPSDIRRRNIRSEALAKLAKLSAQDASGKTAESDFRRIYKRCPSGAAAHNGSATEDGVLVPHVSMVRSKCLGGRCWLHTMASRHPI